MLVLSVAVDVVPVSASPTFIAGCGVALVFIGLIALVGYFTR